MSQRPLAAILPILAALSPMAAPAQDTPKRVSISVKEADLKDILRAVTEGTTYNLTFEPGLNTRLQGLDLKEVTLEEILTDILPTLGLDCSRQGRTLFIHKADERLKFYHVNQLAMKRTGSKSFTVNASGQTIQTSGGASGGSGGGQGGASGSSSAYTSSLDAGTASDPWAELESGLAILVFGAPAELAAAPDTGG